MSEQQGTSALALTPPMGWNSWNLLGGKVNEAAIRDVADSLIETGMKDVGYEYVVIDDLWHTTERDSHGNLQADPQKFPGGIKALAAYVHERGLKLGIYSDAGPKTCAGMPGSMDNEERDAELFASWDIDFLKYDYCYAPEDQASAIRLYTRMGQALINTGRPILFSICEWGGREPWLWGKDALGHMWRTTADLGDYWNGDLNKYMRGIEWCGFSQHGLEQYAGPGHWNDPDMLVVGLYGQGHIPGGGCTDIEYRTHMSLWCLLGAPLMVACDPRTMNAVTREILTNPEVLALDQDRLGKQGFRVSQVEGCEVWKKPLQNGDLGVGLFNRGPETATVTARWSDLAIEGSYTVRDLWARDDLGIVDTSFSAEVPSHGVVLLRLTPLS